MNEYFGDVISDDPRLLFALWSAQRVSFIGLRDTVSFGQNRVSKYKEQQRVARVWRVVCTEFHGCEA